MQKFLETLGCRNVENVYHSQYTIRYRAFSESVHRTRISFSKLKDILVSYVYTNFGIFWNCEDDYWLKMEKIVTSSLHSKTLQEKEFFVDGEPLRV